MKERIERLLRIQQIRKSTAAATATSAEDDGRSNQTSSSSSSEFHLAVCATIVDDFPHEQLWKRWITPTTIDISHNNNKMKETKISCSAELYIHAKHPQHIKSSYLKSKLLPFSHTPNWNDVRVIRAMLSLLRQALRNNDDNDEKNTTTHVLFCTESCIPIVTLGEAARSILLNEVCVWEEQQQQHQQEEEEEKEGEQKMKAVADTSLSAETHSNISSSGIISSHHQHHQQRQRQGPNWNRSYLHYYNQNSPQCTRFDEHNCWSILSNSIPPSSIYKALPGWCVLSRKHAEAILDLSEKELGGMNLWPAFERVWAPEEVYFATALSLCGYLDANNNDDEEQEVSKRSLTYSEWDTRASNHKDRAHPLTYDDKFDYELVRRIRNENGALFLRKLKRELDLNVWEEIVIRRGKKGCISSSSSSSAGQKRALTSTSSSVMRSGYDYYTRDRDRGHRPDYRERNDRRHHYDSRRNPNYGNGRDRGEVRRQPQPYDRESSSKRHRWR